MPNEYKIFVPNEDSKTWSQLCVELCGDIGDFEYPVEFVKYHLEDQKHGIVKNFQLTQFFYIDAPVKKLKLEILNPGGKPNVLAINLALLLVNLSEIQSQNSPAWRLPEEFILAAGLRATTSDRGEIEDIPISTLPEENRNSVVLTKQFISPSILPFNFNNSQIPPFQPCVTLLSTSCVFFPMLANGELSLGWFTVFLAHVIHGQSIQWQLNFINPSLNARDKVRARQDLSKLVNRVLPHCNNHKLYIEWGGDIPSQGQHSWNLAAAAAIQIAMKTMPAGPWPLVATGCIFGEDNYEPFRLADTDDVDEKFALLSKDFVEKLGIVKDNIQIPEANTWFADNNVYKWQYAYPEQKIDITNKDALVLLPEQIDITNKDVLLTPVSRWRFVVE